MDGVERIYIVNLQSNGRDHVSEKGSGPSHHSRIVVGDSRSHVCPRALWCLYLYMPLQVWSILRVFSFGVVFENCHSIILTNFIKFRFFLPMIIGFIPNEHPYIHGTSSMLVHVHNFQKKVVLGCGMVQTKIHPMWLNHPVLWEWRLTMIRFIRDFSVIRVRNI